MDHTTGGWDAGPGVVVLPDGRRVRGASLRRPRPAGVLEPELAVLLLGRRPPATAWPHCWIRWPDFRLPRPDADALGVLAEAWEQAAERRVEICCTGGVGRTGTAIAVLARLSGLPADRAVAWTREHYHPRAVETPWQRRWVRTARLPERSA